MFTGIIQTTLPVAWVNHSPTLTRYALSIPPEHQKDLALGASISVNGVCQTVVEINNNEVVFEAIEETLKRTNIATFQADQLVNIERSAKIGDEIGGHLLSGHIIGTAILEAIHNNILKISCPEAWIKMILPKGYIALNGASLTVVDSLEEGIFTVHLIPETLKRTTFGNIKVGDKINVEIDSQTQAIVETVESILKKIMQK